MLPTQCKTLIRAERYPQHAVALPCEATQLWELRMQLVRGRVWDTDTTHQLRYSNEKKKKNSNNKKTTHTPGEISSFTPGIQRQDLQVSRRGSQTPPLYIAWGLMLVEA